MHWVGSELAISVRKSGRCSKVGHSAANQGEGSAQQPRMLNKEVVKRKEKRDCEEGRINELSLGYSFPLGVPAAGSHLGAPSTAACGSCCALGQEGLGPVRFPVGCGELGAKVSPALASLTPTLLMEQHFYAWHFVSLDHLQRLKPAEFTPREKVHGETGKHFHVGYIARRMLNAGPLINVQKMTGHGQEELALCMDMDEFVNMLDSWKKVLLFSNYV